MKGLDLAATQRLVADLVRAPSAIDGDVAQAAVADLVATGNSRLSAAKQLEIYREQFFLRHLEVLRDDLRALEHLLGDEGFAALTRAYLAAHPPTSFTLRDLGASVVSFVTTAAPWSEDPFVADVARVEWAFVEAFDAPDAPSIDGASIAAIPEESWPAARIMLQPSLQRLALAHPAHDYRLAARASADAENLLALATLAPPDPRPTFVIVYRDGVSLLCLDVEPNAFALLDELANGATLGDACERVARASGESEAAFDAKVAEWFQTWTRLGWISRIVS